MVICRLCAKHTDNLGLLHLLRGPNTEEVDHLHLGSPSRADCSISSSQQVVRYFSRGHLTPCGRTCCVWSDPWQPTHEARWVHLIIDIVWNGKNIMEHMRDLWILLAMGDS
jgi:hypothetical protein